MFDAVFTEAAENDKYARQVRGSAGIAVFVSQADDKSHWIEAGRAFQRFALQAVLGIRNAHLNQPVEVASLRLQFANWLGIARGRPDLAALRPGPEIPRSLRRPVVAVLAPGLRSRFRLFRRLKKASGPSVGGPAPFRPYVELNIRPIM